MPTTRDSAQTRAPGNSLGVLAAVLRSALFTPFLRGMLYALMVAFCGAWLINVLGESTVFNSPDILYGYRDPVTGEMKLSKGCRIERVLPDGSCDRSISLSDVRRGFPAF